MTNCGVDHFQCKRDSYCISIRFVCDGINDCKDKSDELECNKIKLESYYCDKGSKEIAYLLVCDGILDCLDESDEHYCG